MASLYELTGDYARFADLMQQEDLTDDMKEALSEALANMGDDLEEKLENYAKVIKNFESDIAGLKAEELRLSSKRKTMENSVKTMKQAMTDAMILTGKTKVKGELFSFNVQKNTPSVVMDCQYIELVPDEYLKQKEPEIDRAKLKEVLSGDDTQAIERLEGIAHLEQSQSVRIR